MKTVIVTSAEKLPENMVSLKEHMAKQDVLYVFTENDMIPVACFREMSSLPCRTEFITVQQDQMLPAIHLILGLSAGNRNDGIFVVGIPEKDLMLFLPEGIGMPPVRAGASCGILDAKAPVKRSRKKTAKPAGETEEGAPTREMGRGKRGTAVEADTPREGNGTAVGRDISRFSSLLYAYCGKDVDINGREEEIAQAFAECISDVSLDMMLRMHVVPEIPGLYDSIRGHYKELKAALDGKK